MLAVLAQTEKAAQRIDLMDQRCDAIEDNVTSMKEHMLRKEKEFEDMQLEKQLEQLRRELAEAKSGLKFELFCTSSDCPRRVSQGHGSYG